MPGYYLASQAGIGLYQCAIQGNSGGTGAFLEVVRAGKTCDAAADHGYSHGMATRLSASTGANRSPFWVSSFAAVGECLPPDVLALVDLNVFDPHRDRVRQPHSGPRSPAARSSGAGACSSHTGPSRSAETPGGLP